MAARTIGTLVSDDQWGLALLGPDGTVRKVLWPYGFSARQAATGRVLLDASGEVVLAEGNLVELGGGEIDAGRAWIACQQIRRVRGPVPSSSAARPRAP